MHSVDIRSSLDGAGGCIGTASFRLGGYSRSEMDVKHLARLDLPSAGVERRPLSNEMRATDPGAGQERRRRGLIAQDRSGLLRREELRVSGQAERARSRQVGRVVEGEVPGRRDAEVAHEHPA